MAVLEFKPVLDLLENTARVLEEAAHAFGVSSAQMGEHFRIPEDTLELLVRHALPGARNRRGRPATTIGT